MNMTLVVATFYKFVQLEDLSALQATLLDQCHQQIKGTILLAAEGINGTIAGSRAAVDSVLTLLRSAPRLADLEHQESVADAMPFDRFKVRIKPEIVTLGLPAVSPSQQVGQYVSSQEWNHIISDPEVTVIDTRNQYEVRIGSFENAQDPRTDSFRDFPDYVRAHLDPAKHRKVALFCTGGIRCEKATSFLLSQGFQEVYHLKGGILKYLKDIPAADSLWQGECFVFDRRVAVKQGLEIGSYGMCPGCGQPISEGDTSPQDQEGVCCPYCSESMSNEQLTMSN